MFPNYLDAKIRQLGKEIVDWSEPQQQAFSVVVGTQPLKITISSLFLRAFVPVSHINCAQGLGDGVMGWQR